MSASQSQRLAGLTGQDLPPRKRSRTRTTKNIIETPKRLKPNNKKNINELLGTRSQMANATRPSLKKSLSRSKSRSRSKPSPRVFRSRSRERRPSSRSREPPPPMVHSKSSKGGGSRRSRGLQVKRKTKEELKPLTDQQIQYIVNKLIEKSPNRQNLNNVKKKLGNYTKPGGYSNKNFDRLKTAIVSEINFTRTFNAPPKRIAATKAGNIFEKYKENYNILIERLTKYKINLSNRVFYMKINSTNNKKEYKKYDGIEYLKKHLNKFYLNLEDPINKIRKTKIRKTDSNKIKAVVRFLIGNNNNFKAFFKNKSANEDHFQEFMYDMKNFGDLLSNAFDSIDSILQNAENETFTDYINKIRSTQRDPQTNNNERILEQILIKMKDRTDKPLSLNPIDIGNGAGDHLITIAGVHTLMKENDFGKKGFTGLFGQLLDKSNFYNTLRTNLSKPNNKKTPMRDNHDSIIPRAYDPSMFSNAIGSKLWASLEHNQSGKVACNPRNSNKCESKTGVINRMTLKSTVDYAIKRMRSLYRHVYIDTSSNNSNNNGKRRTVSQEIFAVKDHLNKKYVLIGKDHIFYKAIVLKLDNEMKGLIKNFKPALKKYIKNKNKNKYFDIVHYCYDYNENDPLTKYKTNSFPGHRNRLFLAAADRPLLDSIAKTFYEAPVKINQ